MFLTRDRGKKRGVAKNARQSRRRFGGALEPMTCGRVGVHGAGAARAGAAALCRADAVAARRRSDGATLGYVSYFAELIDECAPDADPNETLFRLGSSVVDAIVAGVPADPLARYFEYWLLRLQGVYQTPPRSVV